MNKTNQRYLLLIFCLCTCLPLPAQELLSSVKIHGSNDDSNPSTNVVEDDEGNYYVHVRNNSDTVFFGNKYRLRGEDPPWYDGSPQINYIAKINAEMEVEDVWQIKNSFVWDFEMVDDKLFLIGTHPNETFYIDDLELSNIVENYFYGGYTAIITKDRELEYVKYFDMGRGGAEGPWHIEVDGDNIYLGGAYNIFMSIDTDTLFTYWFIPENLLTSSTDGQPFLARINYVEDSLYWLKRMGGIGTEFLQDMELDQEGNLVFCGLARTGYFHFTEGDSLETTAGASTYESFFGKLSPEGELLFGFITPETTFDQHSKVFISPENAIYLTGVLKSKEYFLPDTILYNEPQRWRGYLLKYDKNGGFLWGHIIEGDSEISQYRHVTFDGQDDLLVSGVFFIGFIHVLGMDYYVQGGDIDLNINGFDKETGKIISVNFLVGENHQAVPFIDVTENGNWKIFLEQEDSDEVFDHYLKNEGKHWFFMEFDPDIVDATEEHYTSNESFVLRISPNPVHDQIAIDFNEDRHQEEGLISVYDEAGHRWQYIKKSIGQVQLRLNLAAQPAGLYFLEYMSGQKKYVQKFIKQ